MLFDHRYDIVIVQYDIQNCHPAIWPIGLLEIIKRYNKYKKRVLLRGIVHFKSDLINNIDQSVVKCQGFIWNVKDQYVSMLWRPDGRSHLQHIYITKRDNCDKRIKTNELHLWLMSVSGMLVGFVIGGIVLVLLFVLGTILLRRYRFTFSDWCYSPFVSYRTHFFQVFSCIIQLIKKVCGKVM